MRLSDTSAKNFSRGPMDTVLLVLILLALAVTFACSQEGFEAQGIVVSSFAGQKGGQDAKAKALIIGGKETDPQTVPYFATLYQNQALWCGATLIAPDVIVGAAHCTLDFQGGKASRVAPGSIVARIGNESRNVVAVMRHKGFRPEAVDTAEFDISLYLLQTPSSKTPAIVSTYGGTWAPNTPVLLMGNGQHSDKQSDSSRPFRVVWTYPVGKNSKEERKFKEGGLSFDKSLVVKGKMLPTGQNSGACHGDSGGPAIVFDEKNRPVIIGMCHGGGQLSNKFDCGTAIYCKIAPLVPWIKATIPLLRKAARIG